MGSTINTVTVGPCHLLMSHLFGIFINCFAHRCLVFVIYLLSCITYSNDWSVLFGGKDFAAKVLFVVRVSIEAEISNDSQTKMRHCHNIILLSIPSDYMYCIFLRTQKQ